MKEMIVSNMLRRMIRRTSQLRLKAIFTQSMSLLLCVVLSGCTNYATKSSCSAARGANCMMLSEVDAWINSGEIETVYESAKKVKCTGFKCQSTPSTANALSTNRIIKARLNSSMSHSTDSTIEIQKVGEDLYVK